MRHTRLARHIALREFMASMTRRVLTCAENNDSHQEIMAHLAGVLQQLGQFGPVPKQRARTLTLPPVHFEGELSDEDEMAAVAEENSHGEEEQKPPDEAEEEASEESGSDGERTVQSYGDALPAGAVLTLPRAKGRPRGKTVAGATSKERAAGKALSQAVLSQPSTQPTRRSYTCSQCRQPGHRIGSCPLQGAGGASAGGRAGRAGGRGGGRGFGDGDSAKRRLETESGEGESCSESGEAESEGECQESQESELDEEESQESEESEEEGP